MRLFILALLLTAAAACTKPAAKTPVYTYTCHVVQYSTLNGTDTVNYYATTYTDHPTPPQQMRDSMSALVNGGNHPWVVVNCQ